MTSKKDCTIDLPCGRCVSDRAFLRSRVPPQPLRRGKEVKIADLFSGCGGMTLGLVEAGRRAQVHVDVALAVDSDARMVEIYESNFAEANTKAAEVHRIFDGRIGARLTASERRVAADTGEVHILIGGPPCQGHSDLNNHTRRNDLKNALYLSMARAAEVLRPALVVIENVPPANRDKYHVTGLTLASLSNAGYDVSTRTVDLGIVGVPQRRRRFFMVASRIPSLVPSELLEDLQEPWTDHPHRTVRWAIDDLSCGDDSVFETSSRPLEINARRIDFLFDQNIFNLPDAQRPKCHRNGGHSYSSVYGRLSWDSPAPTITTGFGCMGQGRYVHPDERRTLTPHEAARLQTFPDWFEFGKKRPRGVLAKAIGNAVPPLLMVNLGKGLLTGLMDQL